jgi:hypothetical protein
MKMAKKRENKDSNGPLSRAASSLGGAFSRLSRMVRGSSSKPEAMKASSTAEPQSNNTPRNADKPAAQQARPTTRQSDIPMDIITNAYTPGTNAKAGFRSNGNDRSRDQEFALGVGDDRWNDEDLLTNKSGDPRIGTHGRTYEPGEARTETRK